MDPITEFDVDDADVVLRQKPKNARQLAMVDGKIVWVDMYSRRIFVLKLIFQCFQVEL